MSNSEVNPYAAPASDPSRPDVRPTTDAAALVRRWEKWRPMYNLVVGVTGLLAMIPILSWLALHPEQIVTGILAYGIAANLAYFLGPLAELYLIWLAHDTAGWLPDRWRAAMSGPAVGLLLFALGTLFSVLVTVAVGLMAGFSIMVPDQV
jgi:hypothetical protein